MKDLCLIQPRYALYYGQTNIKAQIIMEKTIVEKDGKVLANIELIKNDEGKTWKVTSFHDAEKITILEIIKNLKK
jgi:hypothetical protein